MASQSKCRATWSDAQLQIGFASIRASGLSRPNLALQVFHYLEEGRLKRVVAGFGVKIRSWDFQERQHTEGWFDPALPFQGDLRRDNRRQVLQPLELCLNQALPDGAGFETTVKENKFHSWLVVKEL